MNSEQILLLVAALGVVSIVVVTALGSKKKPQTANHAHVGSHRPNGAGHPNRAQRRKR
jgi:hypothetical protein